MAKEIYNKNAREKALLEEAYMNVYSETIENIHSPAMQATQAEDAAYKKYEVALHGAHIYDEPTPSPADYGLPPAGSPELEEIANRADPKNHPMAAGYSEGEEGGPINGNEIELTSDPSAQQVQKKAIPLEFRVAEQPETVQTLEGSVEAPAGAYIMTGTKGENWPIPADKFEETYDIIDDQHAAKKPIPVPGKQMQEDFFVTVSWSPDKLKGKPGDWLVQYGPGDYGVVEAAIFDETYDRLEKEEPGGDGRQLGWGAAIKKAHPLFYK